MTNTSTDGYLGKAAGWIAASVAGLMLVACVPQPAPVAPASDHWLPVDRSGVVHAHLQAVDHGCVFD
ncbi:MAG: hypothetical protein ACNA7J_03645, partial [Wenzhouxiangella sp.]